MKTKNYFLLVLLTLFLIPVAFAVDFFVDVKPIKSEIFLDESAEVSIKIKNVRDNEDVYQIYTNDISWYVSIVEPMGVIGPQEEKNAVIKLTPNAWTNIGPQKVTLIVKSRNDERKVENEVPIFVKPWDYEVRDYVPSFELKVILPENVDPRVETIPIEVYIRNRNRLNAGEIILELKSEFFEEKTSFPMGPLEERSVDFSFPINDQTEPQESEVEAVLHFKNNSINSIKKIFRISPYSDLVKTDERNEYFFKKTRQISIKNIGNVQNSETFKIPLTFWETLFSKSEPTGNKIKLNGQRYLSWNINLGPLEEYKIELITNYRLVPYIFFIMIISLILYYINRSPVVAKKEALIISTPSGGISELKVVLHIKNRTQETINNIHITDKIPKIAELVKESSIGTIEPTKILRHDKKGTLIKWEVLSLEPYEERVITYRTRSKLNIVGGIILPSCKAKFDTKDGKERIVFSNKCEVKIEY